tara:strand:+ start:36939 stop:37691 length:753 start_codon:yes stop_codon:yes gene_type:complete
VNITAAISGEAPQTIWQRWSCTRQWVCAVLVAAAGMAEPAHADSIFVGIASFEVPERMRLGKVGDSMRINGIDTQVYSFESELSADELAHHFARQWPGQMKRGQAGPWSVLSHRQDDYLVTVQIAGAGFGRTRGFISASEIFAWLKRKPRPRKLDVPLLARTQILQRIESEDYGRHSRTLILVSEKSAAQNMDFYRTHFRTQGYAPITRTALRRGAQGGAMALERDGTQLNISAAQQAGMTIVALVQVGP